MTFDRGADAVYISCSSRRISHTHRVTPDVSVDVDKGGLVVGIEILNATEHLGANVNNLPSAREELSLTEAGKRSGLSPTTLRVQIRNKRLKAVKRGRDWIVTAADLENYLEAVESGRRPVMRQRYPRPSSHARRRARPRP
jgi:excisionase family DNA binding protein